MDITMEKDNSTYRFWAGLTIWLIITIVFAFTLGGCNTMAGLGHDISNAAEGIRKEMISERP